MKYTYSGKELSGAATPSTPPRQVDPQPPKGHGRTWYAWLWLVFVALVTMIALFVFLPRWNTPGDKPSVVPHGTVPPTDGKRVADDEKNLAAEHVKACITPSEGEGRRDGQLDKMR